MREASGRSEGDVTHVDMARRPRVLLLEGEPLLAMTLSDLVDEAGCEVVEARSTAEAVRILEERTDIRVVVADLDMRGSVMGLKLAAMIRERWPPIELILTSSAPRAPRANTIPARGVFLGKPFDNAAMVSTIRNFVESTRAA